MPALKLLGDFFGNSSEISDKVPPKWGAVKADSLGSVRFSVRQKSTVQGREHLSKPALKVRI